MARPKQSIAEQLTAAQLAINVSLSNTEIQTLIAEVGYDAEKLEEGRSLHERAVDALRAQKDAIGAQQVATEEVNTLWKEAQDVYKALLGVVRIKFDKAQQARLGIGGATPRSIAAFLVAADTLFENAKLDDFRAVLAKAGYDTDKLNSEHDKIKQLALANQHQEEAKGAAQQATQKLNQIMESLNGWMKDFRGMVKIKLRTNKQLLEKLGILARTTPTKAQRAARAKTKQAGS